MSNKPSDNSGMMGAAALALPIGLLLADLVGRLRELFLNEWPYISWGLFLIIVTASIVYLFVEAFRFTDGFETEILEQTKSFKAFVNDQLKDISILRRNTREEVDRLTKDYNHLHGLCYETVKKFDELLKQKGPVVNESPAKPADTVQEAIDEIVEGDSV